MKDAALNDVRDSFGGIGGVVHELPLLSAGMSWLLLSSPSTFRWEQLSDRTCSSNPRIRPAAWRRLPRLGYCCALRGSFVSALRPRPCEQTAMQNRMGSIHDVLSATCVVP